MKLMKLAILGAFPILAAFSTSRVEADVHSLDEIEVIGYIFDGPLMLGPNFNTEGDYTYDWGNNGGSSGTGDVDGYDGPMPQICSALAAGGRPDGCTRAIAESYNNPMSPDRPVLPEVSAWSSQTMGGLASFYLQQFQLYANQSLANCYADPSMDATACEEAWVEFQDVCDSTDFYATEPGFVAHCQTGFTAIETRAAVAEGERVVANWLGYIGGIPLPRLVVDVNLPLGTWYLQLNPMNRLSIWMRRGDNCMRWFDAWDTHSCSSHYQNV